jgi:hypothetical protein
MELELVLNWINSKFIMKMIETGEVFKIQKTRGSIKKKLFVCFFFIF